VLSVTGWNLKLLQAFALVAEHRSFRKAADASLRSQSAVSAQIKELESQLGVRLFDRTTRRVSLTPEGAELLDYTQRAFSEIAAGIDNVLKSVAQKSDRVRVACMPTVTAGPLPTILSKFEETYPNVQVSVQEIHNEDIIRSVQIRDVDFGIGVTVSASDCKFTPLRKDEMCALLSPSQYSAKGDCIPAADLIAMPLFLLSQATPTLVALEAVARRNGRSLNLGHRFAQPQTMISMAAAGRGAAVLPRIFISGMQYSGVRTLKITDPEITRELAIISNAGVRWSAHAEALARLTQDVIKGHFVG
jgi:DNA-binding transcriptional LysR family regulator